MSVITTLIMNWQLIVFVAVVLGAAITWLCNFFKLTPAERKKEIEAILINLAHEAEEALGPKTGSIKRSYVYNLFKKNCPFLASITSMEMFDAILDKALEVLRETMEQ